LLASRLALKGGAPIEPPVRVARPGFAPVLNRAGPELVAMEQGQWRGRRSSGRTHTELLRRSRPCCAAVPGTGRLPAGSGPPGRPRVFGLLSFAARGWSTTSTTWEPRVLVPSAAHRGAPRHACTASLASRGR